MTGVQNAFFKFYWFVQRRIAPELRYSQYFYEDVLKARVRGQLIWLDAGCGRQLLPSWRVAEERHLMRQCKMLVGVDSDLPSLLGHKNISCKVKGDLAELPFQDGYFDLITANMVAEHLKEPQRVFREVRRVLKPGGAFILHTPNAFGYAAVINRLIPSQIKGALARLVDGREEAFQAYYRANTPREITRLARLTGLKVVEMRLLATSAAFVIIPPLVVIELFWIRLLMTRLFRPLRTNIITVLEIEETLMSEHF